MSDITLRDSLEAAFEQHAEDGQPSAPNPAPEHSPTAESGQKAERARDEIGRFAKQQTEAEQEGSAPQTGNEAPAPRVIARPQAWKKDLEQDWHGLPEHIRDYITEREAQAASGVHQYKQQWTQAQPIYEAVAPFLPELQQHGVEPGKWIAELAGFNRIMALGTPEQKLQVLAQVATNYGVPLQSLTGQQADPQMAHLMRQFGAMQTQLQEFQSSREQQEAAAAQSEIERFAANAPHFDKVRDLMGQLLQSGVATDLQTAYDKAIRLNDEVWQEHQAQQATAAQAEAAKLAALKKGKAVSPRSSTPTANMGTGGGKKSIRNALEDAFGAVSDSI